MRAHRLTPTLLLLLTLPPLMWAGNAVVGRALVDSAPPLLLNALRWLLALALLLPLTRALWHETDRLREHAGWWLATGFLGMGSYNALQYQALRSSTAMNVTLIAASLPLATLLVGWLGFRQAPRRAQGLGALLSLAGVLTVVSHGDARQLLRLHLVQGDALMLVATLAWAAYSWMLARRPAALAHWPWPDLLAGQMAVGLMLALPMALFEQRWTTVSLHWDGRLGAALAYIAIGPSLIAYRCWSLGVARSGPLLPAVFFNLTPLFAGLLSMWLLGEAPQAFHALAFLLIAAGIAVSSQRPKNVGE